MSLDILERSFSGAPDNDTESEIGIVHVHGYGVNGADVRQQQIAQRLSEERVGHVMPHFCDPYDDGDVLVKVPIGEQVGRLESLLERMKEEKAGIVLAVHSQGTIAAAEALRRLEVKYGELEQAIGLLHAVWMGPVVDTSLEPKRLDAEMEAWPAEIDIIQHIQDRVGSEEWPDGVEKSEAGEQASAIQDRRIAAMTGQAIRGYVHYCARNGMVTDVVIPRDYYQSLDEVRDRHLDNLTRLWSESNSHTVILAGEEEVTDGTPDGLVRALPDLVDQGPSAYVLPGANHRFGGDHRGTIADIMRHRVPRLGPVTASLGDRALQLSTFSSTGVFV